MQRIQSAEAAEDFSSKVFEANQAERVEEEELIPFSSKVKLVVQFSKVKGRFKLTEADRKVLGEYVSVEEFEKLLSKIEGNSELQPQEAKTSFFKQFGVWLLRVIFMLAYIYLTFILLQLALFNLILMGIFIVYLRKLYFMTHQYAVRVDYNERHRKYKKFIEEENERLYRSHNIEIIPGEEGKWLEVQLPDDVEEREKKEFRDSQTTGNH